jgi:2-iminobutanoate/2-iminopropanoate deaminase
MMSRIEFINRPAHAAVVDSVGFSEAIKAGGLLFVSGVVGVDEQGAVVAGGLLEQTRQTFRNLKAVVEHAGGKLEDLVSTTYYVVDTHSGLSLAEDMHPVLQARAEVLPKHYTSATAVRVSGLFYPELLIEIQAIVALAP